jgi:hypothetical protein
MVYTGSFGGVSNAEDWVATIALLDADNAAVNVTGASIALRVCREGNSSAPVLSAQTADGTIVIAGDGLSFSWTIPFATMNNLRPEVYNVFVRMTLNGATVQLVAATLTVIDGGPTS